MSTMRYPAEETNPGTDSPVQDKEKGNEIKKEGGSKDGEDDIFPVHVPGQKFLMPWKKLTKTTPICKQNYFSMP